VKKPVYIFLIILVILTAFALNSQTADIDFIKKDKLINELNLEPDIEIVDKRFIDITGDGINDQIFLMGQKPAGSDSLFYAPLEIIVYDIYQKEYYKNSYDNFNGYEPKMAFYDFTGDKISDIFIETNTGGSGGIYNHLVASFKNDQLKIIFNEDHNKLLNISGGYENNFQAALYIRELDQNLKLDLSFNKEKYIREGIYKQDGMLLKEINPYTYPFGQLKPVDYDLDGVFELKGAQRIVGAYGADTIGYLESVIKYEENWNILEIKISTYLKKYDPLANGNNDNVSYQVNRHAITSGIKEIYYPQLTNLSENVNSIYINKQLYDIVKPFFDENRELSIDYKFTYKSKDLISIKFSGYQKHEGGEYEILKSFNYDLKNNRRVTINNILKDNIQNIDKVNQIIKNHIQDKKLKETFPGLADWMGMYLTNNELILYYLRNDFETKHNKISVPLVKLKEFLSIDLDIKNNETEIFIIEVD